jgi:uncharacterized delta-60 repeat protein
LAARLNSDGSLDPGFSIAGFTPPSGGTTSFGVYLFGQSDGKVIVIGPFVQVNGVSWPDSTLLRLNADGSIDESFKPTVEYGLNALIQQPDGKLLLAGGFNKVNAVSRRGVARLNTDGSLDPAFDPGNGAAWGVTTPLIFNLALQTDGNLLAGGRFSSFNGFAVDNLVRLFGAAQVLPIAPQILSSTAARQTDGSFQFQVSAASGQTVIIQGSTTLSPGDWVPLSTNQAVAGSILFTDPSSRPRRFYRAWASP